MQNLANKNNKHRKGRKYTASIIPVMSKIPDTVQESILS